MSIRSISCRGVLLLACLGMLSPARSWAIEPVSNSLVRDVALGDAGALRGALLDLEGQPIAQREVVVLSNNRPVARVVTGAEGEYSVVGLRAGVHVLAADGTQTVCRFWTPGTAPPVATQSLLLLGGESAVRGNTRKNAVIAHMLSNPLLLIGIGAAAIAIPAIVNGNGTGERSGS